MSRRGVDDELLALYALDALDDAERRLVDEAVAASPRLARDLAEHQRVAAALGEHVAVAPPPGLKDRVMAAAFEVAAPREVEMTEAPAVVVPLSRARDRRRPLGAIIAGGLAVAAALALAVVQLGGSDDTETIELVGAGPGRIEVVIDDGTLEVSGSDLPAVGDDRTYQLWMVDGESGVRSAGLFAPGEQGTVDTTFRVELADATVLAVTVEPAGGSPAATGPIEYSAPLAT